MKIGVLTSSRADYGIYRPLLELWLNDEEIEFEIIAFGQHLLNSFGNTFQEIEQDGFEVKHKISVNYENDSPSGIASNYANIVKKFVEFWQNNRFDWVIALGDRYEMSAAVQASIPFQLRIAHIHAGETTLGAIDEIYRHQISLVAELHFVSLDIYAKRIHDLVNCTGSTTVTGAIGLENLKKIKLMNVHDFMQKWNIDMNIPTLFFIVHPETKNYESNIEYSHVLEEACLELVKTFQLVISLPNSDTNGSIYREMWKRVESTNESIKLIEHFGSESFFSCMKLSKLILGNSSSAILEAASFNKYALNLGDRQLGRFSGENVINILFDKSEIIFNVLKYVNQEFNGSNIYEKKNGIQLITEKLKLSKY
ncbi:MAG: UDP-N-acetylglucosamine 2-epimerase [Bacteroidota bacterium]